MSESSNTSDIESSDDENSEDEIIQEDQLELVSTFAADVYGSDSVNDLAFVGTVERDGTTYNAYTFTNGNGDTVSIQLAEDVAVSGDMFYCENVDDVEVIRKVVFGDTAYIGYCINADALEDSEYDAYAQELATAFSEDESVEATYSGDVVVNGRLMKYYSLSDGTGIAFDDQLNNACIASAADSESEELTFTAIVNGDDGYVLDEETVMIGKLLKQQNDSDAESESDSDTDADADSNTDTDSDAAAE